jgi:hypothetical protein
MLEAVAVGVGIIVAVVVLLVIAIHIHIYSRLFRDGIRMRRKLALSGRTLALKEAKRLIAQGKGMLIVDSPTLGWNVVRVWWAPPEAAIYKRPESWDKEKMCPDEDQVNYDNLIDETRGVAKVVSSFVFTHYGRCPYLRRHFGMSDRVADCPFVFTGGVMYERDYKRRRAAKTEPGI